MTEQEAREKYVNTALRWLSPATVQSNARHAELLGIYNAHRPLPRGYKMQATDPWCAAFASVPGIQLGWTDILPPECSCGKMIELYRAHPLSRWEERDDYMPRIGDMMMYGWDDPADNYAAIDYTGPAKHVGIVCGVVGEDIRVLEGNYSKSVKIREMRRNGRFIRGYCLPAFSAKSAAPEPEPDETKHWAYPDWQYLNDMGIKVHDTRFGDPMTRGEAVTLAARLFRAIQ